MGKERDSGRADSKSVKYVTRPVTLYSFDKKKKGKIVFFLELYWGNTLILTEFGDTLFNPTMSIGYSKVHHRRD